MIRGVRMNYQVVIPVLVSFAISLILGPVIIPFLRKLKMGQTERVEFLLFSDGTARPPPVLSGPFSVF